MNGEQLSEALRGGQRVYGTHIASTSPHWATAVATTGVDFVFIDTEHAAIDRETLAWMCQTYRALGLAPVVRVPEPEPYRACMALDGGAVGVLAPYVERPAQVRALRGAIKLRPLKGQLLEGVLNGETKLNDALASYIEQRNANAVMMINIESVPAMNALDEILSVQGLDAVQIGPHDLSCSLGVPEEYGHPIFDEAVREIISKTRARGIGAGIHFWEDIEQEIEWVKAGANLVMHSSDITLFAQTLRADIHRFRKLFGNEKSPEANAAEVAAEQVTTI